MRKARTGSVTPFRHHLELCNQHRLAGWTTAPSLTVAINDHPVAQITPELLRPDLLEAGIGTGLGFSVFLPGPLRLDDEVSLTARMAASCGAGWTRQLPRVSPSSPGLPIRRAR
jgi:hypothetical protein